MHDTAERIRLVKQRAEMLQKKGEKRSLRALCALCLILTLALAQTFASVTQGQQGACVQEMLGATLMFENAGAYVLVGVLSFTAAVIITMLSLRHRHKKEISRRDHLEECDSYTMEDEK